MKANLFLQLGKHREVVILGRQCLEAVLLQDCLQYLNLVVEHGAHRVFVARVTGN